MFRVETFTNPTEYYRRMEFFEGELHINPVYSLAEAMKKRASELGKENVAIYSYKVLSEQLFPEWHSPYTKLYLFSRIRSLIRDYSSDLRIRSFEAKIEEIYKSFVYTVDLFGITLADSPELTEEQRIFMNIANELNKERVVINYVKQRATLSKTELVHRLQLRSVEKIYVYQLDVLDASRMMLFHLLKRAGIDVIFRIPYDQRFQKVYQGWRTTYEKVSNQSANSWYCFEQSLSQKGTLFASHLDGKINDAVVDERKSVVTMQFDHPVDFKQFIKEHPLEDGKHEVVANHYMDLNRYTHMEEKPKFFSKPYGKFILYLSECKIVENNIEMAYKTFIELMTSGWVKTANVSGMNAITLLTDLEAYMDGVRTMSDIKDRLISLVELQEVSKEFDQLAKEQVNKHRIKRFLANPFRVFPFVHQTRYKVTAKQLLDLTRDLERKLSVLLLPYGTSISVQKFIAELKKIFEQVRESWEEEDASYFGHTLQVSIQEDWTFEQGELLELLTLKLNKDLNAEKDANKVKPLKQMAGAVLRNSSLHITDLSLKSFPERNLLMPEFITHTWMKQSVQQSFASANQEIRIHSLLVDYYAKKSGQALSLYQLYYALAFHEGELTLSWINHLQENDSQSMYLQMIHNLYNSGKSIEHYGIENKETYDWELETSERKEVTAEDIPKNIPELYWLDYDFCAKKFYYTTFLQHQPIYENNFHQELVFASLGRLLSQQGDGRKEFRELFYPLFPQWTNTKKDNLIDTEYFRELREYKHYENISYPVAFNRIQILRSQYRPTKRYKIKNQYKQNRFKVADAANEFVAFIQGEDIIGEAGAHCRMCPHLSICMEGEYVIDANKDGAT